MEKSADENKVPVDSAEIKLTALRLSSKTLLSFSRADTSGCLEETTDQEVVAKNGSIDGIATYLHYCYLNTLNCGT